MDRLLPDVASMFTPQTTRFRMLGASGTGDVKAYAITSESPSKLIAFYAEDDPEAIAALKACLNAGIDKGISMNTQNLSIEHGKKKWQTEVRTFPEVRRAAMIAYHPSVLKYNPVEHGADCYLLQDNPNAFTPWFVYAFGERLKKIVDIPVQTHWYETLLRVGIDQNGMKRQYCLGCDAWLMSTNAVAWGDMIEQLLREKKITMKKEV